MNSVIVGAIDNYQWTQIETWWKSIKLVDYTGEIHMLTYSCDTATREALFENNIQTHTCDKVHGQIVVDRFMDYAELAHRLHPDTWMICTDVSDIVFQYNPDLFLETLTDAKIVVASEGIFFKGNNWTRLNMQASFPNHYDAMANEILYNAGSIAVRAGTMTKLGDQIFSMCMNNPQARNHDQAALNILLRVTYPYKEQTIFTKANGPWCYCGASSMFAKLGDAENYMEELPQIRDGICYVNGGNDLTCMFHHYNRNPVIEKQVRERVSKQYRLLPK